MRQVDRVKVIESLKRKICGMRSDFRFTDWLGKVNHRIGLYTVMKNSDFMAKVKNNKRAPYAYLTVILFSIFLLLQQTSWVADDWYGARVSRESLTAPVYSHYVPAAIATWRFLSLLGMDRTLWSLFVVLSIFLIWLGMRKMSELYIANTWLPFVSLVPICSAFGTY